MPCQLLPTPLLATIEFHPFTILAVGVTTVLGLILVLRMNAFLALIISAITVSLMAPGSTESKIQRVADAFGSSAGSIAIVIGLAAIIGECMMASGAADRIVQAFLRLLGEKRAPWALLSSGYVLAVPVFFDTVFYLLVPLARSLFRRTGKNYLLYILAIAAGGAITHTLVPPTPGPLAMASTLGVDVGVMILVGALVALPAAIAALGFSHLLNRWIPIPFRDDQVIGTEDDDPQIPQSVPPLWLSVLPVLLPVLLISANTALTTLANNQRVTALQPADLSNWDFLRPEQSTSPVTDHLLSLLSDDARNLLSADRPLTPEEQVQVLGEINAVLGRKSQPLYRQEIFDSLLPKRWKVEAELAQPDIEETRRAQLQRLLVIDVLVNDLSKLKNQDRERLGRLLLEAAYPDDITAHVWQTPLRRAADLSSIFGNANFALLLSTIVALLLLYKQKRPTLAEMSQTVEVSLMSGGTIILITAAGGAFGAMLTAAGIGREIEAQFVSSAGTSGMIFLLLGYGVAALMKVAQGSSTVAMITVSGMLAAMVGDVNLGYHPVYLATAIGAGSLMGSWMNDSGFWIFTKMGRLTESESLRSWTLMLMVLSITSLGTTLLFARLIPLT